MNLFFECVVLPALVLLVVTATVSTSFADPFTTAAILVPVLAVQAFQWRRDFMPEPVPVVSSEVDSLQRERLYERAEKMTRLDKLHSYLDERKECRKKDKSIGK